MLKDADFFSVLCDSSTDRSEDEKEIVYVRIVKNGLPTFLYMKLVDVKSGKADGIVQAIDEAFADFDMDGAEWRAKMIGFGSDGASVMTGKTNGVAAILQRDVPWLVQIHCLAHRLELAIKDCLKDTYMDEIVNILVSVYYFYKGSPKRLRELESIADIMDEQFLKPERANGTRWVEHKQKALAKLEKTWRSIVVHLESYASDMTNRAEDRAKARGINNRLLQYKVVLYMHFLLDVFDQMSQLSLLFQRDDITVPSVVLKCEHVQLMLTSLLTVNGSYLESFYQHAAQIFDPRNWPDNRNDLTAFGREDLQTLLRHFEQVLANTNPPVNANDVNLQWEKLLFRVVVDWREGKEAKLPPTFRPGSK
ncbi:zinc finger protein 862-like [Lingula anatina]|uniref:Zinc finger protein 862-like n=1 Tax=Lingula anatina TaxID=7574 RepID=A0A2R2MKN8_LINAN|nr:zinc finger protein 862-like [Lingula anatina]|eukprot:XP_023930781.1 zinc finger protein 862-like [Lingula anatina]